MFKEFFQFEFKLRLRSLSTYVFFLATFLIAFFSVSVSDFGPIRSGKVLLNGAYAMTFHYTQIMAFGLFVVAAVFGVSILRDFQLDTYALLFTKPISKFAYLGGRWAASLLICVVIFSGAILGAAIGTFMPWADKTRLAPIGLWNYLQPFLIVTVVQIFVLGSIFFAVAALSRRLMVVYLQGVAFFVAYLGFLIAVVTTNKLERQWSSILDPLGLLLIQNISRYWTVAEKNALFFTMTGPLLYNRLLWLGIALMGLLITFLLFPMSAEVLGARGSTSRAIAARRDEELEKTARSRFAVVLPRVNQVFGVATSLKQLVSLTRLRFFNITREVVFWALVLLMLFLAVINGYFAGEVDARNVWPVTHLMVAVVQGTTSFFFYIIVVLYAGELIWRERDVRFEQIHDSLPVRDSLNWWSRWLALSLVALILLTVVMVIGICMQAVRGYFHFELLLYCKELYLVAFSQIMMIVLLALFVHTLVSNKFVGHALIIGFLLLIPILTRWGFEDRLYIYSETTPYTYSDMNGYGHFIPGLFWSSAYWLFVGGILGTLAILFSRRDADGSFAERWRQARDRTPGLLAPGLVFALLAAGSGAWIYYNTHRLNEFRNAQSDRHLAADYERSYKKYQRIPQPKVTAVDMAVQIFPETRSFTSSGHYLLVNHTNQAIDSVHVTDNHQCIDEVRFDRAFQQTLADNRHRYFIYKLDPPLQPGENLRMDFRASVTSRGFKNSNELAELARNGTFFDRLFLPFIGYNDGVELEDPVRRREENLGPLQEMAPREDPYYSNVNLFTSDSEWITFHTVVSTSLDQIALAPGYLKREWTEGRRRYFEYDMGNTRINNFFSFLSGRYQVKRDQWNHVKLEIYYHPGHEYNLDLMLDAAKTGLNYYETNFGPYQFDQFRVLEFPRYRQFAQSFPNTIPYSEDLGFIERLLKADDIDFLYFVTAHELAHQWWGHQLIGSQTQGSNMMSESLAEYSALKVMQKKYGEDMTRRFLRYELDGYLRGRAGEVRHEPPLVLVQREPYVWYQKGSLVMFALADYIGEDKVNQALRSFLEANRYATGPFPDTRGFVAALRKVTPPELQYVVTDMFESIVLYENKAVSATYTETPEHRFKVSLKVSSQKKKADGSGNESPLPIHDLIDIGVFSGTREHLKRLDLHKEWITQQDSTFEIVIDEKPSFAGIDPYNKLIDRDPSDNLIEVEKKQ